MNNQKFPPPISSAPSVPILSQPADSLEKISKLFGETFRIYKRRFLIFLGVILIPLFISLPFYALTAIIFLFIKEAISSFLSQLLLAIIFAVISLIFGSWINLSLLYALKEKEETAGVKEFLSKGWHKILSYLWISFLAILITALGSLFLIVPGIIFAVWFSSAAYVLVNEEQKGIKALSRSKQLVKGNWRGFFGRFFLMAFIFIGVTIIVSVVVSIFEIFLLETIVGIIIMPLPLIFGFLIYENLAQLKKTQKVEIINQ